MASLKTDYKDDIFTGSRKYAEVDNGDGTISFTDETTYDQVGDSFGAAQINEIDTLLNSHDSSITSLNSSVSSLNSSMTTANNNISALNSELTANSVKFYFDYKNGKYGFNTSPNRGADTFVPFKQSHPYPWWSNSRSASYTIQKTGLYYLFCCSAGGGRDDHGTTTTATISRSGSAILTASAYYYFDRDGDGIFASNSTNIRLSAGQVLNMSATSEGWGAVHLGQMFVVAYADD